MKQELVQTPNGELEIQQRIKTIRGVQVMLDWDIAELYGVETRSLNQAVKRNKERFPPNFRFQLTKNELSELITDCDKSDRKRHYPGTPAAFTEQGMETEGLTPLVLVLGAVSAGKVYFYCGCFKVY